MVFRSKKQTRRKGKKILNRFLKTRIAFSFLCHAMYNLRRSASHLPPSITSSSCSKLLFASHTTNTDGIEVFHDYIWTQFRLSPFMICPALLRWGRDRYQHERSCASPRKRTWLRVTVLTCTCPPIYNGVTRTDHVYLFDQLILGQVNKGKQHCKESKVQVFSSFLHFITWQCHCAYGFSSLCSSVQHATAPINHSQVTESG